MPLLNFVQPIAKQVAQQIPTSKDEIRLAGIKAAATYLGGPLAGQGIEMLFKDLNKGSDQGGLMTGKKHQSQEVPDKEDVVREIIPIVTSQTWLPMPQNISTNYQKNWTEASSQEFKGGLAGNITAGLDQLLLAGSQTAAGYSNAGEAALRHNLKATIDYKMKVLFQGLPFRSFNYPILFQPKNSKELDEIIAWIDKIKLDSAPSQWYGAFWKFPNTFTISFFNNGVTMFETGEMACTNIEVNYTPNNIWSQHEDGRPTAIQVNLSFTEMELLSKENIVGK